MDDGWLKKIFTTVIFGVGAFGANELREARRESEEIRKQLSESNEKMAVIVERLKNHERELIRIRNRVEGVQQMPLPPIFYEPLDK